MIIFCNTLTPRLKYIADFIGKEISGQVFTLTDHIDVFKNAGEPRINYSNQRLTNDELWLVPHTLLFEKSIQPQKTVCFEINNMKAFFKGEGDYPFDIFAATFYLLSRYEEYLPHQKDMYGRYAHENSLAYKENFLTIPLINVWLKDFKEKLKKQFSSLIIQDSTFTFLPTYDIDEAYSFKYKEWYRSAGAALKDLINRRWHRFELRRKVLNNAARDPFDAYDWIDNLHRPYKYKPLYFFLVAERTSRYDRNILPKEMALQVLIKQHAEKYEIGVHPSWQSGEDSSLIKKEINTLESITKLKITSSRQHFIRFTLPETFRKLIDAGVRNDFSMGYGSVNGFRASVASSFYWYDLEKEETTSLLLHPFCFMEANSFFEQRITPQQAVEEMQHYYKAVKQVSGELITIWHNTFLGTDDKFKGWRQAYSQFVESIS